MLRSLLRTTRVAATPATASASSSPRALPFVVLGTFAAIFFNLLDNNGDGSDRHHNKPASTCRRTCQCESSSEQQQQHKIQRLDGTLVPKVGGGVVTVLDHHQQKKLPMVVGRVEAWKDVSWKDHRTGRTGDGYIQLSFIYTNNNNNKKNPDDDDDENEADNNIDVDNDDDDDIHWIQFIKRQKWDKNGNPISDDGKNIPVDYDTSTKTPNLWHRRGEWFLDVPAKATTPYYDDWNMTTTRSSSNSSSGTTSSNNNTKEISILDKPQGILDPRFHSKLMIQLETYLIIQRKIVYRIQWQVVEETMSCDDDDDDSESQVVVSFVHGGKATSLRPELQQGNRWTIGYNSPRRGHRRRRRQGEAKDDNDDDSTTIYLENKGYTITK